MDSRGRTRTLTMLFPDVASLSTIAKERGYYAVEAARHVRHMVIALRQGIVQAGVELGLRIKTTNVQLFDIEDETTRMIERQRGRPIGAANVLAIVNPSPRQLGAVLQTSKSNPLQSVLIGSTEVAQIETIRRLAFANETPMLSKAPGSYGVVHRMAPMDLTDMKHIDAKSTREGIRRMLLFPNVEPDDSTSKESFHSLTIVGGDENESQPEVRRLLVEDQTDRKSVKEKENYLAQKKHELDLN